jgi:DNA repair protein RecN (Recombination protein N)
MLKSLIIQNYALIDSVEIQFFNGFSVITGETGAGKSILLGALSLVLGNRADTAVLKNKEEKCLVEAHFSIKNYGLKDFFKANELEYENDTIIRRTIAPSGKSRAFINDEPVNLNILKELGDFLIDIHSQHHNLLLHSGNFQLQVVDSFAGIGELLALYRQKFSQYKKIQKNLDELQADFVKQQSDYEYNLHRYKILELANLEQIVLEDIESERDKLANAEEIKLALAQAYLFLAGEPEMNMLSKSKEITSQFNKLTPVYKTAGELAQRLDSVRIELKDISDIIHHELEAAFDNPDALQTLNSKIDSIYGLFQNFRVKSIAELIEIRDFHKAKLDVVENFEFKIGEIKKEMELAESELDALAQQISFKRKDAAPRVQEYINKLLRMLGMPNANFVVEIKPAELFLNSGKDELVFMFSANKNIEYQEIAKVASGGEISRLMLTIKSLLSRHSNLPTIIFDEIDTGVSGDIASKMGQIMQEMGQQMQVISITHLPQVAARGKRHYVVYKSDNQISTTTNIALLTDEQRVEQLAKMLSGEALSNAAIENAKELLAGAGLI